MPTSPVPRPAWLPPLWAVLDYAGPARSVILAYKEQGCRSLADPLGTALAGGLRAGWEAAGQGRRGAARASGRRVVVVPIPSSAAARRTRGDQPTLRLARVAVRRLRDGGVPAELVTALEQRPGVRDQAGLSATERARNLDGALRIRTAARPLLGDGADVLLADDIVTSGATLSAAARVLAASDILVAGAAVVAATQREFPRPAQPTPGEHRSTSGESLGRGPPADRAECRLA